MPDTHDDLRAGGNNVTLKEYVEWRLESLEKAVNTAKSAHESLHTEALSVQKQRDAQLNDVRLRFVPRPEWEADADAVRRLIESETRAVRQVIYTIGLLLVATLIGVIADVATR